MSKPWGPNEPNSGNQRWSRWTFDITSPDRRRRPSLEEVRLNAMKFARVVFRTTVGECRVRVLRPGRYEIAFHVEGPPVHDPAYRETMRRTWLEKFTLPGFGPQATLSMDALLLAGSYEDGRPSASLIVAPAIRLVPAPAEP
jgi:hypothetical protein